MFVSVSNWWSTISDQQIFIISHEETDSHSCWAPFVVEVRMEPSTFRFTNLATLPVDDDQIYFIYSFFSEYLYGTVGLKREIQIKTE
jgi:hypothetical protein